jgi:hypothetical protein
MSAYCFGALDKIVHVMGECVCFGSKIQYFMDKFDSLHDIDEFMNGLLVFQRSELIFRKNDGE